MCKLQRILLQGTPVKPPPNLRKWYHYTFLNPLSSIPLKVSSVFVLLKGLLFHFLFSWTFYKWDHTIYTFTVFYSVLYSWNSSPSLHAIRIIDLPLYSIPLYFFNYWWIHEVFSVFLPLKTVRVWIFWTCALLQVYRSFSQINTPRSKHVFNLATYCQTIFENGCKGSPVVKIPCLHFRRHGFDPWSGN